MPEKIWVREDKYRKMGVPEDNIYDMVISPYAKLFAKITEEWDISPVLASVVLIRYPKRLKKKGLPVGNIDESIFEGIFNAYREGKIPADAILFILEQAIKQEAFSEDLIPDKCSEAELNETVENAGRQIEKIDMHNPESKERLLMGFVMDTLRGRISGSKVKSFIEDNYNTEDK
jgi:Glu-tRNA(Gln) amidotransferase subunit E-like FAD-binding protein